MRLPTYKDISIDSDLTSRLQAIFAALPQTAGNISHNCGLPYNGDSSPITFIAKLLNVIYPEIKAEIVIAPCDDYHLRNLNWPGSFETEEKYRLTLYTCSHVLSNTTLPRTSNITPLPLISQTLLTNNRQYVQAFEGPNGFLVISNTWTWEFLFKFLGFALQYLTKHYNLVPNSLLIDLLIGFSKGDVMEVVNSLDAIESMPAITEYKLQRIKTVFRPRRDLQRQQYEQTKNNLQGEFNRLQQQANTVSAQLQETLCMLTALESLPDEDIQEGLLDFIKNNKYLEVEPGGNDRTVKFIIKAPLKYWDQEAADGFIARRIKVNGETVWHDLFKAAFQNQTVEIICRSIFLLDVASGQLTPRQTLTDNSPDVLYRHPHIDLYQCIGDNKFEVGKCIQRQDYIGLINQLMGIAYQLNFFDGTVCGGFLEHLMRADKCVSIKNVKTGEMLSLIEFNQRRGEFL